MFGTRRMGTIGHYRPVDTIPADELREMIAKAKAAPVKHLTVGVYKNGDFKTNCVPDFELEGHIKYNTEMRWGRGLFVDGKCVHAGYLNEEEVAHWEEKCKTIPMPEISYPRH